VKDIRRATHKQYSAEEKIRIVLDGLRGEHSIAELCRREGVPESLYLHLVEDSWRLASGALRMTPRATTRGEVKGQRREPRALKELVVEQAAAATR
jgi:transposase